MVYFQIFARLRIQAFLVRTRNFFAARTVAEICRRPSDVIYISLKVRVFYKQLSLIDNRFMAAYRNLSALVKRYCTKIARAETPPRRGKAELNLRNCGNSSVLFVHRVICPHIRQSINFVHLIGRQRIGRAVYNKPSVPVLLCCLSVMRILYSARNGILLSAFFHFLVRRHIVCVVRLFVRNICSPVNIGYFPDGHSAVQKVGNFNNLMLAHTVYQNVRTAVKQHRTANLVVPVVVMCKTPQACLDSADNNRHVRICFLNPVAVNYRCTVGTHTGFSARGIKIRRTVFFVDSVPVDHTVHIPGRTQKRKSRFPEPHKIFFAVPVGKSNYSDGVSAALQNT